MSAACCLVTHLGNMLRARPVRKSPISLLAASAPVSAPRPPTISTYSFLKNWWQWATSAAPPQIAGLGGALEIGGESANALIPYNVNTQNTRQRFWDGHDTTFRDDVSMLKGNHLIAVGGQYERNYDYHLRNDNGQGIDNSVVYQVGNNNGLTWSGANLADGLAYQPAEHLRKLRGRSLGHCRSIAGHVYAQRPATDAATAGFEHVRSEHH